jgi:hypothetical protein
MKGSTVGCCMFFIHLAISNLQFRFKYNYPMNELSYTEKVYLRHLAAKYWYLIEGKGKVLYFFNWSINSYADAHSFQRDNFLIILFYILTVPLVMIFEYILEQTNGIEIGDFNLKSVFRVYIMVYTFWASTTLQSFSRSFSSILPFVNFERQLGTFLILRVSDQYFRQKITINLDILWFFRVIHEDIELRARSSWWIWLIPAFIHDYIQCIHVFHEFCTVSIQIIPWINWFT